ncbi:MAG: glycosyl hydrolase, partial [Chloroflexota bacterium]
KLAGSPTIAFRDIKIQRRDSDLVGATFGRGFYVLDDYAPLRDLSPETFESAGTIFPVRDAWWYVPQVPSQSVGMPTMGATLYKTPNPDFGASITYWLKEEPKTAKAKRNATEKKAKEEGKNADFPGWETLWDETNESDPVVMIIIKDADGNAVRRLSAPAKSGMHRISWDLRIEPPNPIKIKQPTFRYPWESDPRGALVAPGQYSAEMLMVQNGKSKAMGDPQTFTVKPTPNLPIDTDFNAVTAFQKQTSELLAEMIGASTEIGRAMDRLKHLRQAILATPAADTKAYGRIDKLMATLRECSTALSGDQVRSKLNEPNSATLMGRMWLLDYGHWNTTQEPTATMRESLEIATTGYADVKKKLTKAIDKDLVKLEKDLAAAGAPWTPGRRL